MNITIVGRKCTPRESFKQRVEKKLSKLEKFFSDEAAAKVTATVEKDEQIVEITLTGNGIIFRCEQSAPTLDEAFDLCLDSLVRRIRRYRTKVEKKTKRSFEELVFAPEAEESEEKEFDVVRTKSVFLKPENVEEAILQMNMLGHSFYWFINADTDEMNIVYRRKGGGYGLMEPGTEEEE